MAVMFFFMDEMEEYVGPHVRVVATGKEYPGRRRQRKQRISHASYMSSYMFATSELIRQKVFSSPI